MPEIIPNEEARVAAIQKKLNGTVAALTYGFMAHNNWSNLTTYTPNKGEINSANIGNRGGSTEIIRRCVNAFAAKYKTQLTAESSVCDPKYIPMDCIFKDKNGFIQHGAMVEVTLNPNLKYSEDEFEKSAVAKTLYRDVTLNQNQYSYISENIALMNQSSPTDAGFELIQDTEVFGIIPFAAINGAEVLKTAIQNGTGYFFVRRYNNGTAANDIFWRYYYFKVDSQEYLSMSYDLMHWTTYKVKSGKGGGFNVRDGILFQYLPNVKAIAMVTRHPNVVNPITIDGSDPENMTDYTKPYYTLIKLPILQSYYDVFGKALSSVAIHVKSDMKTTDTTVVTPLIDHSVWVYAFDRVYQIGTPIMNSNKGVTYNNNKRLFNVTKSESISADTLNDYIQQSRALLFTKYINSKAVVNVEMLYPTADNSSERASIGSLSIGTTEYNSIGFSGACNEDTTTSNVTGMSAYGYCDKSNSTVLYPCTTYKVST